MAQFVGFMMDMISGEEFLAPVEANSREEAYMMLERLYPGQGYTTTMVQPRADLSKTIAADAKIQPGMAKPRQPLEQLLARVTAQTGGLPPMPRMSAPAQPAKLPVADSATVSAVQSAPLQAAAKPLEDISSLRAPASARGRAVEPEADILPTGTAIAALRALRSGATGVSLGASAPAPATTAPTSGSAQPRSGSLIAVLKAMKH